MTLLGINYLNVSITVLVVIFVFVCLMMVFLVLMQRPKQEGLGAAFGAGTTDQLFGARTTSVLQRGTVYLAVLFFVLTFSLAVLMQKRNNIPTMTQAEATPAVEETVTPEAPKSLDAVIPPSAPVTVTPGEVSTVDLVTPPAPAESAPVEQPAAGTPAETPAETTPPQAPTEPPAEENKTPQQ